VCMICGNPWTRATAVAIAWQRPRRLAPHICGTAGNFGTRGFDLTCVRPLTHHGSQRGSLTRTKMELASNQALSSSVCASWSVCHLFEHMTIGTL